MHAARVTKKRQRQAVSQGSGLVPGALGPPSSARAAGFSAAPGLSPGTASQINLHGAVGRQAFTHRRSSWMSMLHDEYVPDVHDDHKSGQEKEKHRARPILMSESQDEYNLYLVEAIDSLDNLGSISCTIYKHTKICLRRYESTRWIGPGQKVRILALTNIDVDQKKRRQGRALKTLRALRRIAADQGMVLVVENVVSKSMHGLLLELKGEALPGSRLGARGAHYWLPPSRGKTWQDMAV